jgi:hypothetical protein
MQAMQIKIPFFKSCSGSSKLQGLHLKNARKFATFPAKI